MFKLNENMRIKKIERDNADFVKYLLDVGEGNKPEYSTIGESMIKIPDQQFCDENSHD